MRVRVGAGDDAAALARAAAAGGAESVLLLLDPAVAPLPAAQARAAVGPLAVEVAPGVRVNMVAASADADAGDVEAATGFLEGAGSTTGQVVEVSARA